jgi:hypothetical protein
MEVPSALLGLFEKHNEIVQFGNCCIDIALLSCQQRDALATAFDRDGALRLPAIAEIIEVDHLADLGKTEADALAS